MTEPLTDSLLLQRAGRGDAIAFSELTSRHYHRAVRIAFGMLGEIVPAEDLVQEAFARIGEILPSLSTAQAYYIALYRAVVVLSVDFARDSKPRPLDEAAAARIPEWLRGVLEELPLLHRAALLLRELEGFSYDALAATLRLRRSVISRAIAQARMALIAAHERAGATADKRTAPPRRGDK